MPGTLCETLWGGRHREACAAAALSLPSWQPHSIDCGDRPGSCSRMRAIRCSLYEARGSLPLTHPRYASLAAPRELAPELARSNLQGHPLPPSVRGGGQLSLKRRSFPALIAALSRHRRGPRMGPGWGKAPARAIEEHGEVRPHGRLELRLAPGISLRSRPSRAESPRVLRRLPPGIGAANARARSRGCLRLAGRDRDRPALPSDTRQAPGRSWCCSPLHWPGVSRSELPAAFSGPFDVVPA